MDLATDNLPENIRRALQSASTIQFTEAAAPNIAFYQWVLVRAKAGVAVEMLTANRQTAFNENLNASYFQRLEAAGGCVFSLPPSANMVLQPFILLDHAVLIPPEDAHGFFQIDTQPATVAKFRSLFERYKSMSVIESAPGNPAFDPAGAGKNIKIRFSVEPDFVEINERFELWWEVEGAGQVRIEPLVGMVPSKGSRILSAEQSTSFRLTATNARESVSAIAKVSVNPAPKIEYLLAAPGPVAGEELPLHAEASQPDRYGIVKGQALRLYWRTYNAQHVHLDDREVPPSGNTLLLPQQLSAYTLTAAGPENRVQKTILVDVFPRPEIERIAVAPLPGITIASPETTPFSFTTLPSSPPLQPYAPPEGGAQQQTDTAPRSSNWSLRHFFWFCSGASRQILEQCPPSENAKYTGIGGAIFFTGLLAALSGGYALYTAFQNAPAAILFGLLWGAVIFNLDRLIVSSIKKEGSTARQWRQALPRIALAAVLSVVIAKPLELRIFEPEIMEILSARKTEKMRRTEAIFLEKTAGTEQRIAALKAETEVGYRAREALYQEYRCECDGTCGTGRVGRGSECERKEAKYRQADAEYQAMKSENDRLIAGVRNEVTTIKKQEATALHQLDTAHTEGLVARISAAQELPFWPGFFIALLILLVEIAPVVSKIMAPPGAYDEAVRIAEARFAAGQAADLHQDETQLQQRSDLRVRLHQVAVDQEVERREAILRLVADAQVRLAKEQLEQWLEEERNGTRRPG